MKAKETLLARLRFEREARRAFLPRFGHGRYADAWTLLHVFSGVTLGLGCLLLHIRPYPALFIVLVLAFAYEAMEAFIGIAEDIENSLTDVAAAACGAILAYLFAPHAAALPALAFFGFLLLDALVLALGWRAYLARRLSRGPSGAKPLRRAAKRARTLFFGAALASIPAPLLAALDLRFAFAWFGGIALATFALGARRRDSSR